jgi:hypothetical protein
VTLPPMPIGESRRWSCLIKSTHHGDTEARRFRIKIPHPLTKDARGWGTVGVKTRVRRNVRGRS